MSELAVGNYLVHKGPDGKVTRHLIEKKIRNVVTFAPNLGDFPRWLVEDLSSLTLLGHIRIEGPEPEPEVTVFEGVLDSEGAVAKAGWYFERSGNDDFLEFVGRRVRVTVECWPNPIQEPQNEN